MFRVAMIAVCVLSVLLPSREGQAAPIQQQERDYQQHVFQMYWKTHLDRRLDRLPTAGGVPLFRVPYSGHDYPDSAGGTDKAVGSGAASPLKKYDRAFNANRLLATDYERQDVTRARTSYYASTGLFGFSRRLVTNAPGWHGHCNGWTAAAIRHAEPQDSVVRNGVTFTPADIKALLADIYMYCETEHLGGVDPVINPGTLHITLANWLGRAEQPVGMEAKPGEVVYNYPIYAYKTSISRRSERQAEVTLTVLYAINSRYEVDESPRLKQTKQFHYMLDLDENGEIVGGQYFRDSSQIDMLWTPLRPVQGGEEGNEIGNPHIDVREVMAMWRESVSEPLRAKWLNVDPLPEDADVCTEVQPERLWGGWRAKKKPQVTETKRI